MTSRDDTKHERLVCDAWNGSRTPGFLKFKRDLQAGLSALFLHEDDYSVWQAMTDTDQGGQAAGADALPAQGQNGHVNAVRKRKRRQCKAFERVYAHVDDERLREMLSALPDDDRRGAGAWALVLAECDQGTTDLEILDIKAEFESASIEKTVGYSADTVTLFARELNSLNARLPAGKKYSPTDMSIKILSSIISPETLALEALAELKAATGNRRFERTVTINGN